MKVAIRYYSKTGNTKKLEEALGEAIDIEVLTVDNKLSEDVDILFLGSSVYAAGVDSKVKEFIENIDVEVGEIVNFSSAALIESTYKQVEKICHKNDIKLSDKEFHCRGSFKFIHKGHPNDEDLDNIRKFGKNIVAP